MAAVKCLVNSQKAWQQKVEKSMRQRKKESSTPRATARVTENALRLRSTGSE